MRARTAGGIGIAVAVVVGALAFWRRPAATEIAPAVDTTRVVRIVRRDRVGLPQKQGLVRDPPRVRNVIEALGVDHHPPAPCPADYADADFGLVLGGSNVYVKRNVYVFGMLSGDDAGVTAPTVVSVTSAGCRVGPPANLLSLRRELKAAGTLD